MHECRHSSSHARTPKHNECKQYKHTHASRRRCRMSRCNTCESRCSIMLSFRLRGQVNESLRSTAVIFETPSSLQHMKQSWRKSNDRLYGRSVEIHPSVSSSSGKVVVHNAAHTSSRSSCWPFTGQTSVRHTFSENTSLSSTPCSEAQSRFLFPLQSLRSQQRRPERIHHV